MKNARIAFGIALVAFAACSNGEKMEDTATADTAMGDMPGMSHTAAPTPLVNPNDATIPQLVAAMLT